jgi:DNA-binding NarL/FixJ family response regulator
MRVMIVDSHPATRDALKTAFGLSEEIDVVGEAGSGEEAIDLADKLSPNVVFMNVRLPGMTGLQATRIIRERRPDTKVILFTSDEARETISMTIQAGISGYFLKDAGVNGLVHAAKQAMTGKAVIHPTLTQAFIEEVQLVDKKPSGPPLSPREIEILQKVAYGATTTEVADQLRISFHTVKSHLEQIFEKLGANDRAQAVAIAIRQGLVE